MFFKIVDKFFREKDSIFDDEELDIFNRKEPV